MCGILGWVGYGDTAAALARVRRALPTLAHRGPDGAGYFVYDSSVPAATILDDSGRSTSLTLRSDSRPRGAGVVLGHRRLAIIDLTATGQQPMASRDGRYVIVLNGEIYNYLELRRELERSGRQFRGRSDTEVLLEAFAEWGAACLPRLVGMYAFAVVDTHARRLFLARDCFGIKPLFYSHGPAGLSFASEIRALMMLAEPGRQANPQRIRDYLHAGITDHGGATLLADVQALPPAHSVVIDLHDPQNLTPVCHWAPDLTQTLDLSFDAAASRLRELFLESISLHLRSDTRVGVLLSGGLDSTAIVMAMRHLAGPSFELHTFSYIGDDGAVNEEPWIDLVNRAASAEPHKLRLRRDECANDLEALLTAQGEPFRTLGVYAQYRLFGLARETGVKVLLEGHGSDELLGGYPQFRAARLAALLRRGAWSEAGALLRGTGLASRLALQGLALALPPVARRAARHAAGRWNRRWVSSSWCRRHGVTARPPDGADARGRSAMREALWLAARERSLPSMLRYEDRNSMAHSVEDRVPFLTPALAEFLLALPEEYLVASNGTGKAVFRAAMRGLVPDAVLQRDKVGFSAPLHTWLPNLPALPALLEAASRIPAVNAASLAPLLGQVRAGRTLRDVLLRRSKREQVSGSHWIWWLAGLAAWAERFSVQFD